MPRYGDMSILCMILLRLMSILIQITTTLTLPKLGGSDELSWETAKTYSNTDDKKAKLKYKKVTDYAGAVAGSYKALRNIPFNIYGPVSTYTWLGTRYQGTSGFSFNIYDDGSIDRDGTYYAFGLRAAQ